MDNSKTQLTLLLRTHKDDVKRQIENCHHSLEKALEEVFGEIFAWDINLFDPIAYLQKFEPSIEMEEAIQSILIINLFHEGFYVMFSNLLHKLKPLIKKFFPKIEKLIAKQFPEMKKSETRYNDSKDITRCKYYREVHQNKHEIHPQNYGDVMERFNQDPEKYMKKNLEIVGHCLKSGINEPNCKNCLEIDILGRCCEKMAEALEHGFLAIEKGEIIFNKANKPLRAFNIIQGKELDPNSFFLTMTLDYCPFCQEKLRYD